MPVEFRKFTMRPTDVLHVPVEFRKFTNNAPLSRRRSGAPRRIERGIPLFIIIPSIATFGFF